MTEVTITEGNVNLVASALKSVSEDTASLDDSTQVNEYNNSLSFAKDVKLGFHTVPTGNRTPGRLAAVHYTTAASRQLHTKSTWPATLVSCGQLIPETVGSYRRYSFVNLGPVTQRLITSRVVK